MILRHERTPKDGQPPENTFVAIDERSGDVLGSSVIYTDNNPVLYPIRPLQVRIQLESMPVPDMLLGATVARAQELCHESGEFCRLFTHCAPDDTALLKSLEPFGFEDTDGLLRMQLHLPAEIESKAPAGCIVVEDDLKDPDEQKFFLERYNELFNTRHDRAWLDSYIDRDSFTRIMTVAQTGIAGEVLIWKEGYSGVIGFIMTSKRWRRFGVATHMLKLACEYFESIELYCAETNVRARYPHVLKLLQKVGFTQSELLMRYPGLDINPQ